jgi:hypothetical protein
MVLDGAIDPALGTDQMVIDQAKGFESVLDDFFTWCASTSSCPWRPVGDPTAALLALIDASARKPPGRRRAQCRDRGVLQRPSRRPVLAVVVAVAGRRPGPGGRRATAPI